MKADTAVVLAAIDEACEQVADLSLDVAFAGLDAAMSEGAWWFDGGCVADTQFARRRDGYNRRPISNDELVLDPYFYGLGESGCHDDDCDYCANAWSNGRVYPVWRSWYGAREWLTFLYGSGTDGVLPTYCENGRTVLDRGVDPWLCGFDTV